jgi:hypothetical protein
VRAARLAGLLCGLALSAGAGTPETSSLARLADAFAREVARQARGRAVELSPASDRTGRGGALALDFDELARTRVGAVAALAAEGPRVQVLPVLAEAPGRLIVSARLVEQPAGQLQDIVSVSIEADASVLALAARPPAAAAGQVDLVGTSQSAPIAGHVLDMAFLGEGRLLVLGEDELALYRWDEHGLVLASRRRFTGPLEPVRHAGGLLRAVERERSAWVATSRAGNALLFTVDETGLVERQQADAVPWPGSPAGLRFRPGTDLIEGTPFGLGGGPFLHVEETGVAVDREGRLLTAAGPSELRVGPTLAPLWPRQLAASTAAPPGERDAVLILSMAPPAGPRVISELPVSGSVRALAAQVSARTARLVAAVETPAAEGASPATQTHLVVFELATPAVRP